VIVEFCGFSDEEEVPLGGIISPPRYMLVKVPGKGISLPGMPPDVVGIEPKRFPYSPGPGRSVSLLQFHAILAYSITDYKCQGQTYTYALLDLKRPERGCPPAASLYFQLSRVRTLEGLSIMCDFDISELSVPL
jgi:hypothetical protein